MIPETVLFALWVTLIFCAAINLAFYLFAFSRISFYKASESAGQKKPVSVIICAKNEVNNLRKYLHLWMDQDYPDFELIIVNDCSWDETEEYLKEEKKKYPLLKVVTIPEQDKYRHGKKFAVALGIKAAKNEILLFSDADCMPAGRSWISEMESAYLPSTEIVLGYGAVMKEKGFLNRIIRFDSFHVAMQYFSFALLHNPYMGVGRNLSYKKDLFFRTKGFARHNHLLSGDDDLFVNENATGLNTALQLSSGSFTFTEPKKTFGDWMQQKSRHGATARYYKGRHKFQLGLLGISNLAFMLLLITLLILRYEWKAVLILYGIKLMIQWTISYGAAKKLHAADLMWLYPVHEFLYTLLQPVFYLSSLLTKNHAWK
jgi:biofilm PGA synthesis N-glycosyltransferase PgaC